MDKAREKPQPSEAELEILQVLWQRGPCTVREVWETLEERGVRYTTVLKQLQVMAQKGMVKRDDTQRAHRYRAALAQADVQRRVVADLMERVFVGSADQLVMRALEAKEATPEELEAIQAYLEEYRHRRR
jgi:BlaI family penicillinase repressor